MLPIICIVGKSNSGKTTLIEGLIPQFKRRGHRVAVVKHTPHGQELDISGKDSWRILKAGADSVITSGPTGVAQFEATEGDTSLETLVHRLEDDFDLVLAEGYKESAYPKVEVHRGDLGPDLICTETEMVAIVSDAAPTARIPIYKPSENRALADYLDETHIKEQTQTEVARLVVNGQEVTLNLFSKAIITQGVLGMVSALKGGEDVETLQFTVKMNPPGKG